MEQLNGIGESRKENCHHGVHRVLCAIPRAITGESLRREFRCWGDHVAVEMTLNKPQRLGQQKGLRAWARSSMRIDTLSGTVANIMEVLKPQASLVLRSSNAKTRAHVY